MAPSHTIDAARRCASTLLGVWALLWPAWAWAQSGGTPPTAGSPPPGLAGSVPPVVEQSAEVNDAALETLPSAKEGAVEPASPASPPVLDLEALVRRARQGDLRVQAARHGVRVYEAMLREATWAWFPSFETTVLFGGPVPEARTRPGATDPLDVTDASLEGDLNLGRVGVLARARIDAAIPIWTFGKLEGYESAMANLVDVGQAELERSRDEAAYDAARAYWSFQAARLATEALREAKTRAGEARARVQRLLDADSEQATMEDLLKTDLLLLHVDGALERVEGLRRTAASAVRLLAGIADDQEVRIAETPLTLPPLPAASLPQLVETARYKRPETRAIDAGIAARSEEAKIRRAMFYPDFLIAGYGELSWSNATTDQRNPFIYDPYNYSTGGGGLMMRATFDLPQKSARVARVEAEIRKLEAQRELLNRAIGLEVEQAYRELLAARKEAQHLSLAGRKARQWVIAAMSSFEIGIGEVQDVLEPIAALAATEGARAKAVLDARLAEAKLARAVGVLPWELAKPLE